MDIRSTFSAFCQYIWIEHLPCTQFWICLFAQKMVHKGFLVTTKPNQKRQPFYSIQIQMLSTAFKYNPSSCWLTLTSVSLDDLTFSLLQFISIFSLNTYYQLFKRRIYCETPPEICWLIINIFFRTQVPVHFSFSLFKNILISPDNWWQSKQVVCHLYIYFGERYIARILSVTDIVKNSIFEYVTCQKCQIL